MAFCTSGGPTGDGSDHCCYVDGARCPHLMNNAQLLAWINAQSWSANKKNAARAYATGIAWACKIAVKVLADTPTLRNNRANFEAAWHSDPEYLATPRPTWAALEQAAGAPAGSYNCGTWPLRSNPGGVRQCCFADASDTVSEQKAAARGLTADNLTVRRAGRG